jgi:hypothetical protein
MANPGDTLSRFLLDGAVGLANMQATQNRETDKRNKEYTRELIQANSVNTVSTLGDYGGIVIDPATGGWKVRLDDVPLPNVNQLVTGLKIPSMDNGNLTSVILKSLVPNPDIEGAFTGIATNANGEEVPLTVGGTNDSDDQVLNISQEQIENQIKANLNKNMAFTGKKPAQLFELIATQIPPDSSPSLSGQNSIKKETAANAATEVVIERGVEYGRKMIALNDLLDKTYKEDVGKENLSEEEQKFINSNYSSAKRNLEAGSIPEAQLDKLGASYYGGDLSRFIASLGPAAKKKARESAELIDLPEVGEPEVTEAGIKTGIGKYKTFTKFKTDAQTYLEENGFSQEPEVFVKALTAGQRPGVFGKGNTLLERVLEQSKVNPELIPKLEKAIISLQETTRQAQRDSTALIGVGLPKRLALTTEELNVLVESILPPEEAAQVVETEVIDAITPDKFRELANDPDFINALDPEIVAGNAKQIANDNGIRSLQDVAGLSVRDSFNIAVAVAGASDNEPGSAGWNALANGVMNIANGRPYDETSSNRATNRSSEVSQQTSLRANREKFSKQLSDFREDMGKVNAAIDSMIDDEGEFVIGSDKGVATLLQQQIGASRELMASIMDGVYIPGPRSYRELATKQRELLEARFRYLLNKDKASDKSIFESIKNLFNYKGDLDALLSYQNLRVIGLDKDGKVVPTTKIKFRKNEEEVTLADLIKSGGEQDAIDTFKFFMELKALDAAQRRKE